jgi:glycosyltransferase involved in cell wall biosynthesis
MKSIQIFILSYNRPDYLRVALQSLLNQSDLELFDIIVSDNSSKDEVESMMNTEFCEIKCLRRSPSLSSSEHFVSVLQDVSSEYFMLFHDDDIMEPQMVRSLYDVIMNNPNIVSVACNGWYYKNSTQKVFGILPQENDCVFRQGSELIKKYLNLQGVAPFSGYLYKTSAYKTPDGFLALNKCGKHSDVAFIAVGFASGNIVWLANKLMYYRLHDNNDSGTLNESDVNLLLKYFIEMSYVKKSSWALSAYKMNNFIASNSLYGINLSNYIIKHLHVFLLYYVPLRLFRKMQSLLMRLKV